MCIFSKQVIELSKPSSFEVEEVIHQLAQNTLQIFFKEEVDSESEESILFEAATNRQTDAELGDTIGTSRDYLAKLLFWLVYCHASFSLLLHSSPYHPL